jgi:uncharacterized protein with PIN domain
MQENVMGASRANSMTIVKRNDLTPLCCHCSKELTEVYAKTSGVPFIAGKNSMFFCPHCRKVLGFAQSRMI